jgi:hypothetical protein
MSDSGGGGVTRVPISGTVQSQGVATYSGINCNVYNVALSSTSGDSVAVTFSVPTGCFTDPTGMTVPDTGSAQVAVYVPTSNNASISLTINKSGFSSATVAVQ